jgi:YD repeat-containing protein
MDKMKNIKWLLLLLSIIAHNIIYAQSVNDQNLTALNFIQSSPTAAELGKYGNWPVDYFHGMAQIGIPIYTLKVGKINLPISLSYHGSGIKADQEASWVGLGWSLNAGGVITHQVNDLSDFEEDFEVPSFDQMMDTSGKYNPLNSYTNGSVFFYDITNKDCQPDIYSYNFCGYSGRFVFERPYNGKIVFLNNTDGLKLLDMDKTDDVISFSFVDKKGIIYDFNEYEESHYLYKNFDIKSQGYFESPISGIFFSDPDVGSDYISAFYLTKITSPDGYVIEFNYTDNNTFIVCGYSGSLYYDVSTSTWRGGVNSNVGVGRVNGCYVQSKVLNEITTNTGISIEFDATTSREDVIPAFSGEYQLKTANGCCLDNIYLKYDDTRVKRWHLNYDYFGSSILVDDVSGSTSNSDAIEKRLKLISLTEFGTTDSDSSSYKFSYYEEEELPFRFCFTGKDKFGYYNDDNISVSEAKKSMNLFHDHEGTISASDDYISKLQNAIWYPGCGTSVSNGELCMMNFYNDQGYSYSYDFDGGRDGEPDIDCAKINSLKKIVYPTGGYSEFDYDLNKYYLICNKNEISYNYFPIEDDTPDETLGIKYGGGLRIKQIKSNDGTQDITKTFTYAQWGVIAHETIWASKTKPYNSTTGSLDDGDFCTINTLNITPIPGSLVMYAKVIEGDAKGKIIYRYNSPIEYPSEFEVHYYGFAYNDGTITYPANFFSNPSNSSRFSTSYAHFTHGPYCISAPVGIFSDCWKDHDYVWGKIKSKKILDKSDSILQLSEYEYKIIENESVYGLKSHYHSVTSSVNKSEHNRFGIYEIINAKVFPSVKKITDYFYKNGTQDSVGITESYTFDNKNELLISDVVTNNNEEIETTYTYPPHFPDVSSSSVLYSMCDENMIDYVIEKTGYINNKITASELNTYKIDEGNIVPYQSYSLETSTPLTSFTAYNGSSKDSNYSSSAEVINIDYDSKGNPLKIYSKNGTYTYYVWAYNNQYPVAKIISTISTTISATISDVSLSSGTTLANVQDDVTYLKTQLSSYINNASYMVNLYTYKPLVGLTSETTPNGVTTYYNYDTFGRVSEIRDDDLRLLKKYVYNYAQPNSFIDVE